MADPREIRRRDTDYSLAWWIRWHYAWWSPTRGEMRTAYIDVRAWLGGWCNDCPDRGDMTGGGYGHWRCGWRRHHEGLHRARNYVWTDDGRCSYMPIPHADWATYPPSFWADKQTGASWAHRMRRMAGHRRTERERKTRRLATSQPKEI